MIQPRHLQNRVIQEGDQFRAAGRDHGPGRLLLRDRPHLRARQGDAEHAGRIGFAQEAQKFTVDLLRPGASCADVWNGYNDFMAKNGRPKENRLYCHGQGYHLVERPLVRFDESMRLQARMNIATHPMYHSKDPIRGCATIS